MKVLFFILLAVLVIGANGMILLRTAKKPKIPDALKTGRADEDQDTVNGPRPKG
ncbi:MAG: hypothetical protein ACU843_03405 [Gammaproteobacteria bacterium]